MSSTVSGAGPWSAWAPWTDRRGRLHPLRAVVFAMLLLPGAWLGLRYGLHLLGARPLNEVIHGLGYWAAWILIASLAVTPAKAVFGLPNLPVVRRMVGNAALAYAGLHLLFYVIDQDWRLLHVGAEIVRRFYLTIGFVTLSGLAVLGVTSTDGWARRLGRRWKRLHRTVYGLVVLAVVHFLLQTKADVSVPLFAAGIIVWLLSWRLLPAGRDRGAAALLGLAVVAAALTLALEYLWYRFGTRIDPLRVLRSELSVDFGLRPSGRVLALGLLVVAAAQLRRLGQGRIGSTLLFTVALFALAAWVDDGLGFVFGWEREDAAEGLTWLWLDLAWTAALSLLGLVRWVLRDLAQRRLVDALAIGCIVYQMILAATGAWSFETGLAAVLVVLWVLLVGQTWQVSKGAAVLLVPLGALLGYGVAGLL